VGTPSSSRIYLGMWTLHLNQNSRENDRWNNQLVGGVYNGVFGGTLLNSFSDRAFAGGIQRDWMQKALSKNVSYSVGYRVGLITGYDARMASMASQSPVLPFAQLLSSVQYRNLGWEFAFAGVVLSTSFYINF